MDQLKVANMMRRQWAAGDAKRNEGLVEPKEIRIKKNLAYVDDGLEEHLMDIYYPKEEKESYPVIVSTHGGGYFYGDKELYRFYCMHLATKGFVVVNYNYRLSPEHKYPAAIEDVCLLMKHLYSKSGEYRLDLNRVFMLGDSAGAQLTSQYVTIATNEEYRRQFPCETFDFVPRAIALNCGIYDLKELQSEMMEWYMPENVNEQLEDTVKNVLEYMTENYVPVYLMMSVNDDLGIHTKAMKECLEELHIPLSYHEFGMDNKDSGHVFHVNMNNPEGEICNEEECEFFRKTFL